MSNLLCPLNKLPWIGSHQTVTIEKLIWRIQYPCWFVWETANKKNMANPWAMDPVVIDCTSEGLHCSLFHYICLSKFIPWRSQVQGVSCWCIVNGVMPCCKSWPSPCVGQCQLYQPIWRAHVLYFHRWRQLGICFHCTTLAQMEPTPFLQRACSTWIVSALQPK